MPRGAARLQRLAAGAVGGHRGRGAADEARRRGGAGPAETATKLLERIEDLHATLGTLRSPIRPLHGDAHLDNVLNGPDGPLWNDWEDTCVGPLGWDAACLKLTRGGGERAEAALAASGIDLDPGELALWVEARSLQVAVWRAFLHFVNVTGTRWRPWLARLGLGGRRDEQEREDRAEDREAGADQERGLEALGERDRQRAARLGQRSVRELAIAARIARPSAPPICWRGVDQPGGQARLVRLDARHRGDRHRHEREARGRTPTSIDGNSTSPT